MYVSTIGDIKTDLNEKYNIILNFSMEILNALNDPYSLNPSKIRIPLSMGIFFLMNFNILNQSIPKYDSYLESVGKDTSEFNSTRSIFISAFYAVTK